MALMNYNGCLYDFVYKDINYMLLTICACLHACAGTLVIRVRGQQSHEFLTQLLVHIVFKNGTCLPPEHSVIPNPNGLSVFHDKYPHVRVANQLVRTTFWCYYCKVNYYSIFHIHMSKL